ncbi:hypothetical protein D3H65_30675 [Paraflavitalea soli]|uniref:Uncharacterized protein n=1 Tax=Paraflavitalea soli TaxID=2315862 RepID=A0A3B7MU91_9BACT|nr:hypothetical protein [Paraflavitalea soli]AXY78092.1 hypothetical protein D3H65_30675 [Paraflavitalea soli]
MAKQVSPLIKLRGTIDDLNFYVSEDGFMARAKGGVSAERIKNDPKFNLTRLNGLEFGIGGRAGKSLRLALKSELSKIADKRLTSRLTKTMIAILQTDPVNDYGERRAENGDLSQLAAFEFNSKLPFNTAFEPQFSLSLNRATGQGAINLPAYTPQVDIISPDGSTHYNLFAAVVPVNFAVETNTAFRQSTGNLPYDNNPATATTLTINFPASSPDPIFVVLGIEFVKIVNGKVYEQSKAQNALQIVAVDVP